MVCSGKTVAEEILFDPNNIVIDETASYPQYEFIDPNVGQGYLYGNQTLALSTGNVVVTKPLDNFYAGAGGAVYLFNGVTGALISSLTGFSFNDQVGHSVSALTGNGNFVVLSPFWNLPAGASQVGAATLVNGVTGLTGIVSASNSLIGSLPNDEVGSGSILALTNGNYVVLSPYWRGGSSRGQGAATFGNGETGIVGTVSSDNQSGGTLSGESPVGKPVALANGNYAVVSPSWNNNIGAVTWIDGTNGFIPGTDPPGSGGTITFENSLTGSSFGDMIGSAGILQLTNGNYVVLSPYWNGNVGAATWVDGSMEVNGVVGLSNSLVGSVAGDKIGTYGLALTNGNYAVLSPSWRDNTGAATFVYGTTGIPANETMPGTQVKSGNSLTGTNESDSVSFGSGIALTNGNYVVFSAPWNSNHGAATFVNGTTGIPANESSAGVQVSSNNSLIGAAASDQVSSNKGLSLADDNYVVFSSLYNGGIGAATWGDGTTGTTGVITSAESLVGTSTTDHVGSGGGIALTYSNAGNYVVFSPSWDSTRGAATYVDASITKTGTVSMSNSLYGSASGDSISSSGGIALTNGNYVIFSPSWNENRGAATFGTGAAGVVNAGNSLVGSSADDLVSGGVNYGGIALTNGNYVIFSPYWNDTRGAATWGNGSTGTTGTINSGNSLVGTMINEFVSIGTGFALPNGNYIVLSPFCLDGRGAATWGNGSTGTVGTINGGNSLVGSSITDFVGYGGGFAFANSDYVILSPSWSILLGAATYGSGQITGTISASNSLLGTQLNDQVGSSGSIALTNGNYAIYSVYGYLGAVTFGQGITGTVGDFSADTSLVGLSSDQVGLGGGIALANGNYVIFSPNWNQEAGAATFGNGITGITGPVTSSNSLVGSASRDSVSLNSGIALTNGNYVVFSSSWNNSMAPRPLGMEIQESQAPSLQATV